MDSMTQVGKYIKKTRDDTNFALERFTEIFPQIERTRDFFNSDLRFYMDFKTKVPDNTIFLDLNFNVPAPGGDCCVEVTQPIDESFCATCELFIVDGDEDFGPLQHYWFGPYTSAGFRAVGNVFVNGVLEDSLNTGLGSGDDPSFFVLPGGEFPTDGDEIVVCYPYITVSGVG